MKILFFVLCSNQFPEIINTAYHYVIQQTQNFVQEPLISTGLRPHVSVAVDKSTPHRDTNHAILVLLPVNGKHVAMPLDAPLVYSVSGEGDIEGGSGQHLAEQVVDALRNKLKFNDTDMNYVRGRSIVDTLCCTDILYNDICSLSEI